MSKALQEQVAKWRKITFTQETWLVYKTFFARTWDILRETARLLWLLICYAFVSVDWIWTGSANVLQNIQSWRARAVEKADSNLVSETTKAIWETSKKATHSALEAAKSQLDIEDSKPKPSIAASTPKASQSTASSSASKSVGAVSSTPTSKSTPATNPADDSDSDDDDPWPPPPDTA